MAKTKKTVTKFWIGGTSGLARTYFNAFLVNDRDDDDGYDGDSNHINHPHHLQQGEEATTTTTASNDEIDQASNWLILGLETTKPTWLPCKTSYVACDLTNLRSAKQAEEFWTRQCQDDDDDEIGTSTAVAVADVRQIVISIRPPLVSPFQDSLSQYVSKMLTGLEYLLIAVLSRHKQNDVQQQIVHLSSIAAVDHIRRQCLWSETDPDPDSRDLDQPYDRFKRASEELVQRLVRRRRQQQQQSTIEYTSLRLGAIFSDTPTCIQCTALAVQAHIGPYMTLPIDCNSARNASILIRCILQRLEPPSGNFLHLQQQQPKTLRPVYFYTRPLHYPNPIPYGEYLVAYRHAHDIRFYLWVPILVVRGFVSCVHLVNQVVGHWVPYLQSMDYLLQVTKDEHSFASKAVMEDFPQLQSKEETIEACFRRRRWQLLLDAKTSDSASINNDNKKKEKDL